MATTKKATAKAVVSDIPANQQTKAKTSAKSKTKSLALPVTNADSNIPDSNGSKQIQARDLTATGAIIEADSELFEAPYFDLQKVATGETRSRINKQDGGQLTVVLDYESQKFAKLVAAKLNLTVDEIYREGIWAFLETQNKISC